jgi:hypothetical protein
MPEDRWFSYLEGSDPDYPETEIRKDIDTIRRKMEAVSNDDSTPDTRMSDDMNAINPATTGTLTRLMLGGLPTGRVGYPLHCRLRYFDPERRRAGIPEDVAALVDSLKDNEVTVNLANLNQVHPRTVIVQGGAYAEHRIETVSCGDTSLPIQGSHFAVSLAPGCGGRVRIKITRYVGEPTFAFPWSC